MFPSISSIQHPMGLSKERQAMQCCLAILLSEITRHVTLNENFASNYAQVGFSLIPSNYVSWQVGFGHYIDNI
jgi:hypothetical protein